MRGIQIPGWGADLTTGIILYDMSCYCSFPPGRAPTPEQPPTYLLHPTPYAFLTPTPHARSSYIYALLLTPTPYTHIRLLTPTPCSSIAHHTTSCPVGARPTYCIRGSHHLWHPLHAYTPAPHGARVPHPVRPSWSARHNSSCP